MDQSKACSQKRGRDVPKKEKYMQIRGGTKGDHGFSGRSSHHWMVVNIQASVSGSICQIFENFMLALIVLSSITKKGEIVTNMAPFMPFRVILVIE